jgi:membrane-bound metal-dependent hydrolase YbcI (DUF457 family)
MVLGHVAGSALAARTLHLDARMVILAGVFPDLVDKSAKHLFHVVPFGRIPAHTLLGLALTTLAVYLLSQFAGKGLALPLAWLVGYASHLLLDFAGLVPILWPFRGYQWPETRTPFDWVLEPVPWQGWLSIGLEVVLVAVAVVVEVRRRAHRNRAAAHTLGIAPSD